MREPTRIVGQFAAVGIGTLAFLLLAAMANAQSVQIYTNGGAPSASARATVGSGRDYVVITPGRTSYNDPYVRESALRAQVASNLAASRSLAGSNIVVYSQNGSIVLSGTVAETDDIARAQMIAQNTPGVANVVTQLGVDPVIIAAQVERAERLSDAELARRVSERLAAEFNNADIDRKWEYGYEVESATDDIELDVAADDGEIHLMGEVPSYEAYGRALAVARSVPGVVAVRSRLHFGSDEQTTAGVETYPGPFEKPRSPTFFGRKSHDYED
jgi:osmotically-inducible protein OsmY